jgi:anti-sigma B factor antagonist
MSGDLVRLEQERRDGQLVLRLIGEVDLSNVDWLERQLAVAVRGCSRVVIDLTDVDYVDSQGLRLLKQLSDRLSGEGGRLQLIAPPGRFARGVLEMTRLNEDAEVLDALPT